MMAHYRSLGSLLLMQHVLPKLSGEQAELLCMYEHPQTPEKVRPTFHWPDCPVAPLGNSRAAAPLARVGAPRVTAVPLKHQ